jgi:hypothetical protein
MNATNPGQLLPLAVMYVLFGVPMFLILRRIGRSPWVLLWLVLPGLGLVIVMWFIALCRWPSNPTAGEFASIRRRLDRIDPAGPG